MCRALGSREPGEGTRRNPLGKAVALVQELFRIRCVDLVPPPLGQAQRGRRYVFDLMQEQIRNKTQLAKQTTSQAKPGLCTARRSRHRARHTILLAVETDTNPKRERGCYVVTSLTLRPWSVVPQRMTAGVAPIWAIPWWTKKSSYAIYPLLDKHLRHFRWSTTKNVETVHIKQTTTRQDVKTLVRQAFRLTLPGFSVRLESLTYLIFWRVVGKN